MVENSDKENSGNENSGNDFSGIHALLPIKDLSGVKTRLGDILDINERRQLVRAMAEDVVASLKGARDLAGIHVVTHDERVIAWARSHDLGLIDDTGASGLSNAIALAARETSARGAQAILIVLADTPLSSTSDFEALIEASKKSSDARHMILSPSRDGDGSNCMLVAPPDAMGFHYGVGSATAHTDAATRAGLTVTHLERTGIGHDVDTQKDLQDLIDEMECQGNHSHTGEFLTSSGIAARIAQNN